MYRPQRLSYPHLCGFFCFYQEGPPSFLLAFFGEFLSDIIIFIVNKEKNPKRLC